MAGSPPTPTGQARQVQLRRLANALAARLLASGIEAWTRVVPHEGDERLEIGLGERGLLAIPGGTALGLGVERLAERVETVVRYGLAHAPSRGLTVLSTDGAFTLDHFDERTRAWLRFQRWRVDQGAWGEEDGR